MSTSNLNSAPLLSTWQKKQAAMLYHYASLDYLKELQQLVNQAVDGVVDPLLDLAKAQQRDPLLIDSRWGTRDTSENWSNYAWPFLKDFQASIAKQIANRAFEKYSISRNNECMRGIHEFSMQWATPEEEERVEAVLRVISSHANKIDNTLDDYHNSRWSDFGFAYEYTAFSQQFPRIPKFRIRTDVQAESGKVPVRTGVYVSQDDPHAALQFAWIGGGGGALRPSKTFNEIGLDALHTVGRKDLWFNDQKMYVFAGQNKYKDLLHKELIIGSEPAPQLAASAVAREAFTNRPCKWYFVEMLPGEFEDIDGEDEPAAQPKHVALRVQAGQSCPETGYYFTPARADSRRHFRQGEVMPDFDSTYGLTIWQWDQFQD